MSFDLPLDLDPAASAWWTSAIERCRKEGSRALVELFPQLPRRIGRGEYGATRVERPFPEGLPARAEMAGWRRCDVAAALLLNHAPAGVSLLDLYRHGDLDERIAVLRLACLCTLNDEIVALIEEAHRSNVEACFAAVACDGNLAARAVQHPKFGIDGFNRMLLKCAFIGLPLSRVLDATTRANPELSRMLLDLASEREAAGRAVWPDTLEMASLAPCAGVIPRVLGGIEHGDDKLRRAAARGLLALAAADPRRIAPFLGMIAERIEREPRPDIQDLLRRALP